MAADPVSHPLVLWAQRTDKLFISIQIEDCLDEKIHLTETALHFTGKSKGKTYEVTIEFSKEVDPDKSTQRKGGREYTFVVIKKEDGPFWPRLLKDKAKPGWLKVDFNRWKDEDDSDDDDQTNASKEDNLAQMMSQMGANFNPTDAAEDFVNADDEPDSDDEDLPDLEA